MEGIKLVVIGGGSSYTPELMDGLIQKREVLPVREVIFVDIEDGEKKVSINTKLVQRMFEKANLPVEVSYTLNRQEALVGADFVVTQFRVGGLAARATDEKIPMQYGVIGQETTGPGGFAKALRTIPVILDICKDIEALAPKAWLINFTNPAGIITEVINKYTKVKSVGLCNVPINMTYDAAKKLNVPVEEIRCSFIGLNHLSVITSVRHKGIECIEEVIQKGLEEKEGIVKNIGTIDTSDTFAKAFGMLMSPYLQYFFYENEMIKEELEAVESGKGTRAQQVMKVEEDLFKIYENEELAEKPKELEGRGGARYSEVAIALIDSIYNDKGDEHVVNTVNNGAVAELPADAVVEINCIIDASGARPIAYGELPLGMKGLVQKVKTYEQLTIEAAVNGDREKALLALVANPLVHNVYQAEHILEDLLKQNAKYLPQFKGAI